MIKKILKFAILFSIFGCIYMTIEALYKYPNHTHWTMFVVGGLLGLVIGIFNNELSWETPFWIQCVSGGLLITFIEGVCGVVLNIWLGLNVWHYTQMTFFFNQCSVPFMCLWIILAGVAIILDDFLRYLLFNEEWPHYVWR